MGTTFGCVLSTTITGPTSSPEAVRTLAQHADALGFDAVWFPDHILLPRQVTSVYPYAADGVYRSDLDHPFYEPLAVRNVVAGCTQRVRLGTHVLIIPYRPPCSPPSIWPRWMCCRGGT
jgi:alkanesulfonate monooxygenase SsuD/methylene tetrahydromethanopterin reductase-like flavin-dependent oxidoreductase (luciferase family)